jgi:molecular chaperone HscB
VAVENQSASELAALVEPFDPSLDHFARLGLARGWKLDRDAFEQRYLERSRRYHPDRFVTADAATKRAALEHSAAVNIAYRTLRDPVARAEYLVKLGGIDLDSSDPHTGAPKPEQAFLIELIERRERLEHAPTDDLDSLSDEVEAEMDEIFDRALSALEGGDIRGAAAALVHRRYLDRFLSELSSRPGPG